MRTDLVLAAEPCGSADAGWQACGNTILGWVMGLGVVIAIIAVLIIAGKMVQANFTGDPWIAARGMGELPWVLLGIILLMVAAPLVAVLLRGAEPNDAPSVWQVYLERNAPTVEPRDEEPGTQETEDDSPDMRV
ncbi:hypothetical protein [Actinorugispora endophytica]|uniref:Uncharacterized protein n=1 Tax=Actinorugispora endophytica TaxID=1605990 RepID=A0A4R6V7C2_9ACTN|nr:hypothetical protein [Actinorugispora endophytica]TDQ55006.1 hypothetical protein EV190_101327 [Actinorugispora endophytica]